MRSLWTHQLDVVTVAVFAAFLVGCGSRSLSGNAEPLRLAEDARAIEACDLSVRVASVGDAHSRLARALSGRNVIVCPFRSEPQTKVFAVGEAALCQSMEVGGLSVADSRPASFSEVERGVECSAATRADLSGSQPGRSEVFVWQLPDPPRVARGDVRPGDLVFEDSKVTQLLADSGLPFLYRDRVGDIICFEVRQGEPDPLTMLRSVGYVPPSNLRQIALQGTDCHEAVKRQFNWDLPVLVYSNVR
ncbi:hypothetical protein [Phenylobacterium sp.]|uniref:hypothetical protein n=1 Tax=Phenylobacterium sp. TaxID=1871053 RepID=UPI0025ECD417|nr:hypothetical protein [Phenylobacterium sp.]